MISMNKPRNSRTTTSSHSNTRRNKSSWQSKDDDKKKQQLRKQSKSLDSLDTCTTMETSLTTSSSSSSTANSPFSFAAAEESLFMKKQQTATGGILFSSSPPSQSQKLLSSVELSPNTKRALRNKILDSKSIEDALDSLDSFIIAGGQQKQQQQQQQQQQTQDGQQQQQKQEQVYCRSPVTVSSSSLTKTETGMKPMKSSNGSNINKETTTRSTTSLSSLTSSGLLSAATRSADENDTSSTTVHSSIESSHGSSSKSSNRNNNANANTADNNNMTPDWNTLLDQYSSSLSALDHLFDNVDNAIIIGGGENDNNNKEIPLVVSSSKNLSSTIKQREQQPEKKKKKKKKQRPQLTKSSSLSCLVEDNNKYDDNFNKITTESSSVTKKTESFLQSRNDKYDDNFNKITTESSTKKTESFLPRNDEYDDNFNKITESSSTKIESSLPRNDKYKKQNEKQPKLTSSKPPLSPPPSLMPSSGGRSNNKLQRSSQHHSSSTGSLADLSRSWHGGPPPLPPPAVSPSKKNKRNTTTTDVMSINSLDTRSWHGLSLPPTSPSKQNKRNTAKAKISSSSSPRTSIKKLQSQSLNQQSFHSSSSGSINSDASPLPPSILKKKTTSSSRTTRTKSNKTDERRPKLIKSSSLSSLVGEEDETAITSSKTRRRKSNKTDEKRSKLIKSSSLSSLVGEEYETAKSKTRTKSNKTDEKRSKLIKSSSLSSLVGEEDETAATTIPPRREGHLKRSQSTRDIFDSIADALDEIKESIGQKSCNGIGEDWRNEVELMKQDFLSKRKEKAVTEKKKEEQARARDRSLKMKKKAREDSKHLFQQDSQRIKSRMERKKGQTPRSHHRDIKAKEESSRHREERANEEGCTTKKERKDQVGTVGANASAKTNLKKPQEKEGVTSNATKKKTKPAILDNVMARPFRVDVSKWKVPSWKKDKKEKALIDSAVKYLLTDTTPKGTAMMIKAFEPVDWKEGEMILKQGETDDHLYIVKNGTVAFQINDVTVGTGGSGTTFGDQNLLFSTPATVSVVAKETSKIFRLNQETYRGILQQDHRESFVINQKPKLKAKARPSSEEWWKDSKRAQLQKATKNSLKSIDLDELKKIRVVGGGQFGKVWLVSADIFVDTKNTSSSSSSSDKNNPKRHEFVLKLQSTYDDMREDEAGKAIKREIEAMNELSDHPFVATLYKTYESKESIKMLIGLLPGGELWDVIHQENKATGEWYSGLSERYTRFYSFIIADTLGYFHSRQYVYRDLKPSNIMIDAVGYPVFIDFGFCKKLPDGVYADKTFTFCGTPDYLAPELIKNHGHNAAADCWALGVMIFEMISGENPFGEDEMERKQLFRAICKDPPKSLDKKSHSKRARSLIKKLLVKDPACRLRIPDALDHCWFDGLSLEKLREKKYKAPWIPPSKDMMDVVEQEGRDSVEQTQKSTVSKKTEDELDANQMNSYSKVEDELDGSRHERSGNTNESKEPVRHDVENAPAVEEPPEDEIKGDISNVKNGVGVSLDKGNGCTKEVQHVSLSYRTLNTNADSAESTRYEGSDYACDENKNEMDLHRLSADGQGYTSLRDEDVNIKEEIEEIVEIEEDFTLEEAKSLILDIGSEFLIDNDDESEESSVYMSDDSMDHHNVETKQTEVNSFDLHLQPGDDVSSLEVDDLSYIEEEILPLFDVPTLPLLDAWQRKTVKETQEVDEYQEEAPRTPRDVINAIAEDAKREHASRKISETHKSQFVDIAGAAASLGRLTRLSEKTIEAQGTGNVDRQNKQKIDEWKPTGAPIRLSRSFNDIISIEAAAMGRISRLKEDVTETSNAKWGKSSSSINLLLDDGEDNDISIEDRVDDNGRPIRRADALVDRYVRNLREELISQGSQKFAERAIEESEWTISGVTVENVPLPTPEPPKFIPANKMNQTRTYNANVLSREVVGRVWDRKFRLNRPNEELRVTNQCHCKYCVKPNPYQTHAYKRMMTKKEG